MVSKEVWRVIQPGLRWVGFVASVLCLAQCTGFEVELDPAWGSRERPRSGGESRPGEPAPGEPSSDAFFTERGRDQADENQDANVGRDAYKSEGLPENPPDTDPCHSSPQTLSFISMLPKISPVLLVGDGGPGISGRSLQLRLPPGWSAPHKTAVADAMGRFGFLVQRQNAPPSEGTLVQVFTEGGWCAQTLGVLDSRSTLPPQLSPSPTTSCKAGQKITLNFELKGKIKTPPIRVYSTQPFVLRVDGSEESELQGRPLWSVHVSCLGKGEAALLLGHRELAALSHPMRVE